MELIAVSLARIVSFVDIQALDPFGKTLDLKIFKELGKRYSFAKIPETLAEMDFQKGIQFVAGDCGGIKVDKVVLYPNGIVVDTRSATEDCEAVVQQFLDLAAEMLGAKAKLGRRLFLSQLIVRSEMRMVMLNPILQKIIDKVTEAVSRDMNHPYSFDAAVVLNADLTQIKIAPGVFSIERRADTPFSENIYFASAPLRTPEHIKVLEEFEAFLLHG